MIQTLDSRHTVTAVKFMLCAHSNLLLKANHQQIQLMHLGNALGRNDDWHSVDLLYTLTNSIVIVSSACHST